MCKEMLNFEFSINSETVVVQSIKPLTISISLLWRAIFWSYLDPNITCSAQWRLHKTYFKQKKMCHCVFPNSVANFPICFCPYLIWNKTCFFKHIYCTNISLTSYFLKIQSKNKHGHRFVINTQLLIIHTWNIASWNKYQTNSKFGALRRQ